MARQRQSTPNDIDMIRISQTIRGNKHPEIADLYRANHDCFASTVCDALTLYAYLLRKTGARSAIEVMGVIGGVSFVENSRPILPTRAVAESRPAVKEISSQTAAHIISQEPVSDGDTSLTPDQVNSMLLATQDM